MEIDRKELAEMAAVAFQGDDVADVPEKLWCDKYAGVIFVRASWGDGITAHRTSCLEDLRDLVAAAYRAEAVAVAYWRDMEWETIDGLASRLQEVR
jgi:hypothetical protein